MWADERDGREPDNSSMEPDLWYMLPFGAAIDVHAHSSVFVLGVRGDVGVDGFVAAVVAGVAVRISSLLVTLAFYCHLHCLIVVLGVTVGTSGFVPAVYLNGSVDGFVTVFIPSVDIRANGFAVAV